MRIIGLIYRQVNVDVFFLDWEKPRGVLFRHGKDVEASRGGGGGARGGGGGAAAAGERDDGRTAISAWRSIFAVNEWAELSTMRRANPWYTFVVLVALLEGGAQRFVATPQPVAANLAPGATNPVLALAIAMVWYWIIVATQLVWAKFVAERYIWENPAAAYLDLCTIMKISVFVLDEKYRGYYIHGNSPHEFADGGMQEVALNLFEEATAMRSGRGLPGCPDAACQTFEVHVPRLWREEYDRVFASLVSAEEPASLRGGPAAYARAAAGASSLGQGVERTNRLAGAHEKLSRFLRGFIDESNPDFKRLWRERTVMHAAFDFPPDMVAEGEAAAHGMTLASGGAKAAPGGDASRITYMFTDPHLRFERATFLGIELDLAMFDAILFCAAQYGTGSPSVAAAIALLGVVVIKGVREHFGARNLARKTLVDRAFLS